MTEMLPVLGPLTPFVFQLGVGGIAGFIVGYAVKKIAKILVIISGLFFLGLLYLGYAGIISINHAALEDVASEVVGTAWQTQSWISTVVANVPFAATFIAGLGIGLKMG